jgi:hypothetical protein
VRPQKGSADAARMVGLTYPDQFPTYPELDAETALTD